MAKIFGIGLSKTGTSSLTEALRILGYRVIHHDVGLAHMEDYDAVTDLPVANAFVLLDEMYPGSKFIYTTRDLDTWLESCRYHWRTGFRKDESLRDPDVVALHKKVFGTYDYDPKLFTKAYADHDSRVMTHFADRPLDLLALDICGEPEWDELCDFLGKPIPNTPFPCGNTRRQKAKEVASRRLWRFMRPFVPKPLRNIVKPAIVRKYRV